MQMRCMTGKHTIWAPFIPLATSFALYTRLRREGASPPLGVLVALSCPPARRRWHRSGRTSRTSTATAPTRMVTPPFTWTGTCMPADVLKRAAKQSTQQHGVCQGCCCAHKGCSRPLMSLEQWVSSPWFVGCMPGGLKHAKKEFQAYLRCQHLLEA